MTPLEIRQARAAQQAASLKARAEVWQRKAAERQAARQIEAAPRVAALKAKAAIAERERAERRAANTEFRKQRGW